MKLVIKILLLLIAFVFVIGTEITKVYFIMPFPGSQVNDTVAVAYFINDYIFYIRILGWLLLLYSLYFIWGQTSLSGKIIIGILLSFYLFIVILFNYYFVADKIFYQPQNKIFAKISKNKIDPKQLVIGVSLGGKAKAYPIEIIGYHHQVRDSVGSNPVMITYSTVSRSGRVYNPMVDGKLENFRLVGMDNYNALFEDETTKSWWRQVSGEAIAGTSKGKQLEEIPSSQMALRAWLEEYPESDIMQPDSVFQQGYDDLKLYDEGTLPSSLERRDSLSWNGKSWIVGIQIGMNARAYDWNDLIKNRVVNDTLGGTALVLILESDSASFHAFKSDTLKFWFDAQTGVLKDSNTESEWKWSGSCTEGQLKGRKLEVIQSYQEFWHSWKAFRQQTSRYEY